MRMLNKKRLYNEHENKQSPNLFCLCIWVFTFGSLLGYIVEIIYAYCRFGEFRNRQGMIYGPFIQIYGFAAVIFTLALYKLRNSNKIILFASTTLIGGLFEYMCSYIQEIVFKSHSWNYSNHKMSINGRTNPIHAIFWGVLGVIFFSAFLPLLIKLLKEIKPRPLKAISLIMCIVLIFDMSISAAAVLRQTSRTKGDMPKDCIEKFLDKKYNDDFLKKIYPNMKFVK